MIKLARPKQRTPAASFADTRFESGLSCEAWDRLVETHPALIEWLKGNTVDARLGDFTVFVRELHAAVA